MRPVPVPQLQFEFADASKRDVSPRGSRRLFKRAKDVRAALGSLAYEAQWAHFLRTGSNATQRMGWQLLSSARPQVSWLQVWLARGHTAAGVPIAKICRVISCSVPGSWSHAPGAPTGPWRVRSQQL
jgi:hypothetical protein